MDTLRNDKVFFIDAIKTEVKFLLNFVQQNKIITTREYENLHDSNYNNEKITIELLNKVMAKGDKTCQKFLELLQKEEIQEILPKLNDYFTVKTTTPITQPMKEVKIVANSEIIEYKMSSDPRGLCLIINNINFKPPHQFRNGSEYDEQSLKKVFQWLGFTVKVVQNQTAQQIKALLKSHSREKHDGDCFVCCILSHGSKEGVYGVDGCNVSKNEIIDPFNGSSCPTLAGKPKLFFIQACRGNDKQSSAKAVETDSLEEASVDKVEVEDPDMDAVQLIDLPIDADFLVVRSTVKGYVSFRQPCSGSWFIQSLCKQLEKFCPSGEDINAILLCVNEEVSKMSAKGGLAKQMPIHKVTLRKKLVFHVPDKNKSL